MIESTSITIETTGNLASHIDYPQFSYAWSENIRNKQGI